MTQLFNNNQIKAFTYSLIGIAVAGITAVSIWKYRRSREIKKVSVGDLIGNTPLIYLPSLSKAAGC